MRKVSFFIVAAATALILSASDLSQDQMKMLQDPGGWQYITVSDNDSGVQTKHTCFDGHPHPDECSGTLTLRSDKTFAKDIYIHHQGVQRTGTYELNGDQLAFFDEFGTKDGPYTVAIDTANKTMTLDMPQLHIGLELQSAYKKELRKGSEGGEVSGSQSQRVAQTQKRYRLISCAPCLFAYTSIDAIACPMTS